MTGRTPCINPCCKRTGAADQFPGEMICGKCFNGLPQEVRASHNFYWKQIRKMGAPDIEDDGRAEAGPHAQSPAHVAGAP